MKPAVVFDNFQITETTTNGFNVLMFQNKAGVSIMYLWEDGTVQFPTLQKPNGGTLHVDPTGVVSVV